MDLKKLLRLLAPLMVQGVLAVRRDTDGRLMEKLHQLEFVTKKIDQIAGRVVIELQILDSDLLYRLLAGEANKFLLAACVSHERAKQEQSNNASWQVIEHYYAAYFSVHYLLRLTGASVTNIDSSGTQAIIRSNLGAANSNAIPTGLYSMKYDDSSQTLTLSKNTKASGGSHQEAWLLWDALVEKLRDRTNTDAVEYARTYLDLSEHRTLLVRSTAKYNPPEIRGEINYQFKGGLWVFEKNARDAVQRMQRSIGSQLSANATNGATPDGMVATNKLIISIAMAVFKHASETYPKGICRSLANKYSSYVV
ncbi:MAG: hypothetical protein KA260_11290 [Burkholderiales bacterium]|nr:hypothetical protein [Burkholderiales bacterium]